MTWWALDVRTAPASHDAVASWLVSKTGQAVEVILMTMGVYLAISLLTSLLMNWFNRRMALVER